MNDKEIQEKYERSFKELTDTLSPQQIKLFECWFEVATVSQQKHHLLVNSSRENTNYQ